MLTSTPATSALDFSAFPLVDPPTPTPAARSAPEVGRVLHIINGEHFSGAERVQQVLGKRLGQFGFDARFACVKPGRFREHCELRSGQVYDMPMKSRLDVRDAANNLAALVQREKITLLHAHTPRTALISAWVSKRTNIPWIYHVHSPTARDSTRGIYNRVNSLVERYSIRHASRLITVSRSLRRDMLSMGVSRTRLSVVPNGVPSLEPIDTASRLHQQRWQIGMLALMRPRKGVEIALDAMQLLKRTGIPIRLNLIGAFETEAYEQLILGKIRDLEIGDCVSWKGFTNDVATAIGQLDALLLPSLFGEGMPMVVLEALSAGVPVIATRVEGTPEVIRDGIEGYLAEPGKPRELADSVVRLCSNRIAWSEMSCRAVSRHRTNYTDSLMASRVAGVYRRALAITT